MLMIIHTDPLPVLWIKLPTKIGAEWIEIYEKLS